MERADSRELRPYCLDGRHDQQRGQTASPDPHRRTPAGPAAPPRRAAATTGVPSPPPTTDSVGPKSAAVAPLSKAPNSFEKPMKTKLIADTRPRRGAGGGGWARVGR